MTSICPSCGAFVEHERMQDRRDWIPVPGTDKVRIVIDGEVVHERVGFERSGDVGRRSRTYP